LFELGCQRDAFLRADGKLIKYAIHCYIIL
jgi:hypothetical protein